MSAATITLYTKQKIPALISVVMPINNMCSRLTEILSNTTQQVSELVSEYELIIVDNASTDNSIELLRTLTGTDGLPNLHIYALTKEVDSDTAVCVGLENALGDFVVVFDPTMDDLSILPDMLDKATSGSDVVFASNQHKPKQSFGYRFANAIFNSLYRSFSGVCMSNDAPHYCILSKRIMNFILHHKQPPISFRHLPSTAGFIKSHIQYKVLPVAPQPKELGESVGRGVRLIISTTRAPMRLVTFLSLFGATANVVYSMYVVFVGLFVENIAVGWVSMSLQMSGMFFLVSLVLLILGEYILHVVSLTGEEPLYHVGQEFSSAKMTLLDKLNIEEAGSTYQKIRSV